MGPVSLIVPADTVTNDLITPKFDTDSIQVDKAAHTVDVLIFITPSPYNHYDEYRIERLKLFKDASINKKIDNMSIAQNNIGYRNKMIIGFKKYNGKINF